MKEPHETNRGDFWPNLEETTNPIKPVENCFKKNENGNICTLQKGHKGLHSCGAAMLFLLVIILIKFIDFSDHTKDLIHNLVQIMVYIKCKRGEFLNYERNVENCWLCVSIFLPYYIYGCTYYQIL